MGTVGGASIGGSDTVDEADEVLTGGGFSDAAVADLVTQAPKYQSFANTNPHSVQNLNCLIISTHTIYVRPIGRLFVKLCNPVIADAD